MLGTRCQLPRGMALSDAYIDLEARQRSTFCNVVVPLIWSCCNVTDCFDRYSLPVSVRPRFLPQRLTKDASPARTDTHLWPAFALLISNNDDTHSTWACPTLKSIRVPSSGHVRCPSPPCSWLSGSLAHARPLPSQAPPRFGQLPTAPCLKLEANSLHLAVCWLGTTLRCRHGLVMFAGHSAR